jgi:CheY-like chemotaxis protein
MDNLNFFTAVLAIAVALAIVLFLWFRRRNAQGSRGSARPTPAPRASPGATTAPALSLASFTPLPPRAAPAPPVPPPPAAKVPAPSVVSAPPAAPVSLLVVDDSAVARAKLRKLFEGAGHLVDLAADGEEALALLGSKPYSALITDLEMPKLDGFQLIAAVHGSLETEDLPIIAITGHDELSGRVNDMQGLYGIFKKPWNDRELLKRVAAVARPLRPAATN